MQDQIEYEGCQYARFEHDTKTIDELLKKQLGPLVYNRLIDNHRCSWCKELVLVPTKWTRPVVTCANLHPVCDRCWIHKHQNDKRLRDRDRNRLHPKCNKCHQFYARDPPSWAPDLARLQLVLECLPVCFCLKGNCASWDSRQPEDRNLWQWLTNHVLQTCDCDMLRCKKCQECLNRGTARTHFSTACPERKFPCPECGTVIKACQTDPKHWNTHVSKCIAGTVPCEFACNGCTETMLRGQLDQHVSKCPFRWEDKNCVACGGKVMIGRMDSHLSECPMNRRVPCPVMERWPDCAGELSNECRGCPIYRMEEHMSVQPNRYLHEHVMLSQWRKSLAVNTQHEEKDVSKE